MGLQEQITQIYPELTNDDFDYRFGIINFADDSDGLGAYISKWQYDKPIPDGLTLGKPSN